VCTRSARQSAGRQAVESEKEIFKQKYRLENKQRRAERDSKRENVCMCMCVCAHVHAHPMLKSDTSEFNFRRGHQSKSVVKKQNYSGRVEFLTVIAWRNQTPR